MDGAVGVGWQVLGQGGEDRPFDGEEEQFQGVRELLDVPLLVAVEGAADGVEQGARGWPCGGRGPAGRTP
jgi:hypothetical protein